MSHQYTQDEQDACSILLSMRTTSESSDRNEVQEATIHHLDPDSLDAAIILAGMSGITIDTLESNITADAILQNTDDGWTESENIKAVFDIWRVGQHARRRSFPAASRAHQAPYAQSSVRLGDSFVRHGSAPAFSMEVRHQQAAESQARPGAMIAADEERLAPRARRGGAARGGKAPTVSVGGGDVDVPRRKSLIVKLKLPQAVVDVEKERAPATGTGEFKNWKVGQPEPLPHTFRVPTSATTSKIEHIGKAIDFNDLASVAEANKHARQVIYRARSALGLPGLRPSTKGREYDQERDDLIVRLYDDFAAQNSGTRIGYPLLSKRYNEAYPDENRTTSSISSHVDRMTKLRVARDRYKRP